MTKAKNLRVVGGHHRPPTPPQAPEPSVPPATTLEARTAFAEAIAAHLPGTWRLVPDQPDTITFEADSLMNTRRTWSWTVPVRLLKRDPEPGALLLLWTATSGGGTYGQERIVNPNDLVVVGVVPDGTTPEALGKAIEMANWYSNLDTLWEYIERREAEVDYDERHAKHHYHEGFGFTAAWVAERLAKTFLPTYLKALPKLRRDFEAREKSEAKQARERAERDETLKSHERTIADGIAKLRALGYEGDDYDPGTFFLFNPDKPRSPLVYVTGHHYKNHVDVRVILPLSQLEKLLKFSWTQASAQKEPGPVMTTHKHDREPRNQGVLRLGPGQGASQRGAALERRGACGLSADRQADPLFVANVHRKPVAFSLRTARSHALLDFLPRLGAPHHRQSNSADPSRR